MTNSHIEQIELVDNQLLRKLLKAHSKMSIPFLHLETGTLPLKFIIASRRINYLHNIISRDKNDLISRIFEAQSKSPLDGDFVNLIKKDFDLINEPFNKSFLLSMTKTKFKKWVKSKIAKAAFKYLMKENESKSKTKNIQKRNFFERKLNSQKIEFRRGNAGGGNQLRQPYLKKFKKKYNLKNFTNTEHMHFYSLYVGNYPDLNKSKIIKLCKIMDKINLN